MTQTELLDQITIIIPTLDRYKNLKRLLKYFLSSGICPRLLIADSSSTKMDDELDRMIGNPQVSYLKFTLDIDLRNKLSQAFDHVDTEYVVLCADDDFLAVSAITDAVAFMQANLDYSVICGLTFHYQVNHSSSDLHWWTDYRYTPVSFSDPIKRLRWHLANYRFPTFYGVQRTTLLRSLFRETIETTSHYAMMEITLSALNAINGKIGILPVFYSLRQTGDPAGSRQDNNSRSWQYFFENESFREQQEKALDLLSMNLQSNSHLNKEEADSIVHDSMDNFFLSCKSRKTQNQIVLNLRNHLVSCLEKIKLKIIARDVYTRINNFLRKDTDELNITACLKKDGNFTETIALIRKAIFSDMPERVHSDNK